MATDPSNADTISPRRSALRGGPGQDRAHQAAVARAWAVHAFTASGAVLGFLALAATLQGDRLAAFLWLGLALFVDGIDGTLARKARVTEMVPNFDGATLDNVIDYFNYVAVPALMIWWFGMVPEGWGVGVAAAIMGVSTYTFANTGMKSHDYYFVGFPAVWSLVVLYFHVIQSEPWTNLIVVGLCCVLTFVPWKYVHPFRVRDWRNVTIPMTVLWAATSFRLVLVDPEAGPIREASPLVFWLWVLASVYFAGLSAWRTLRN
jgi:phosphatidylcholine synthase